MSEVYYANLEERKAACETAITQSELSAKNAERFAEEAKKFEVLCVKTCCGMHVRRSELAAHRAELSAQRAHDFEQSTVRLSCGMSSSRASHAAQEAERFRLLAVDAERRACEAVSKIEPLHLRMLHSALLELSMRGRHACPIVSWLGQNRQRLALQPTDPENVKLFRELKAIAPNVCELLQHFVGSSSDLYGDGSCLAQLHAGLWRRVKVTLPILKPSNAVAMVSLAILSQLLLEQHYSNLTSSGTTTCTHCSLMYVL